MSKMDGGPAFPVLPPCDMEGASASGYPYPAEGISMRDYFAAKASEEDIKAAASGVADVETILRNPATGYCEVIRGRPADWRQIARYLHADAMLRAREAT